MECLQFQGKETWQINFMGNHQNETWWLPAFFAIPAKQECISTHKVRAQLGVEDDILRDWGCASNKQNAPRVHRGTAC